MENFIRKLKKAFQDPFAVLLYILWVTKCYSQLWEDLIIDWLMLKDNWGIEQPAYKWFYIDIWWNLPIHINNTYFFYKKWWSWINIEPNKLLIKGFDKRRPRDKNLQIAIWKENWELTFYSFAVSQVSTCDPETVKRYTQAWHKVIDTYKVPVWTLEKVCQTYAEGIKIDILSVDVEWLDMEVLKSNDRNKYRPMYVIVETVEHSKQWREKQGSLFNTYFESIQYTIVGETWVNTIYKNNLV
jgi:FkbM family methyltransferase